MSMTLAEWWAIGFAIFGVAVALATLAGNWLMWWRYSGMEARLHRVEAAQASALGHAEFRHVLDRLATLEGQLEVNIQLMTTVQKHLLESEK